MADVERSIFKRSSSTFFIAALFFPKKIRHEVFDLYSFVRVADDYVDQIPAESDKFYELRRLWLEAVDYKLTKTEDTINERVVKNMRRLQEAYDFDPDWTKSFLDTMQADLVGKKYQTLDDTLHYVSGSAEVIGLMMSKIMNLSDEAQEAARMQGRALQWINFIRDVDEDNYLGRQYFPREDLKQFKLSDLSHQTATNQPEDFRKFIQFQIERYRQWQLEAESGYKYIPKRLLIPIKTAADSYSWTAEQISRNPLIVFDKKIKPSRGYVVFKLLTNII
jgi:phytoene synthase